MVEDTYHPDTYFCLLFAFRKFQRRRKPVNRVLLVDDEKSVRSVLAIFLGRSGYKVAEAESGPLALAQLETFQPEIVLLDIRMPGMDGVQTLQKIKERDSKIPVIMGTATTDEGIAQETIQLGARDYIVKSFSFEQLQTHLAVHLLMN